MTEGRMKNSNTDRGTALQLTKMITFPEPQILMLILRAEKVTFQNKKSSVISSFSWPSPEDNTALNAKNWNENPKN